MEAARPPCNGMPFLAATPAMIRVREALDKAARADVRVVLYGQTGVGKKRAAQYLHAQSNRCGASLACLAVREVAALSKLSDPAYVSSLGRGTLLLEGIDEAPVEVQSYLAAAIEDWAGDEQGRTVRVLATAARDLLPLAESGHFRLDLYYLLDVFPLSIPPLQERLEEIGPYMEHFHGRYAPGRAVPAIPDEFLQEAVCHAWPGNLRELENLVAASVARTGGESWALPRLLPRRGASPHPPPFHQSKREFEAGYVRRLLVFTNGNVTRAAELAGKARKDFYALLARNGILASEFRR